MLVYAARRFASLAATLLVATALVFVVLEVIPGDPAQVMLGINAQEDTLAALRSQMGLDRPAWLRYLDWISGFAGGDLGTSYTYSVPVADLVAARITVSLPLALLALALSTIIAIPVGVYAASRRGHWQDSGIMALTQVGIAIPNFWFAMLLVFVFAVTLRLVPSGGFPGWEAGLWPALKALMLPAVALALPQAAILARVMRSSLIDALHEDYVRTARAKGLRQSVIVWRHALRNALMPVVTVVGLQSGFLLGGAVVIETVFAWPGIGRLIVQSITARDFPMIQAAVLIFALTFVMINLLTDLLYTLIDPRVSAS